MQQIKKGSQWIDKTSGTIWESLSDHNGENTGSIWMKNGYAKIFIFVKSLLEEFEPYIEPTLKEIREKICIKNHFYFRQDYINGKDKFYFSNGTTGSTTITYDPETKKSTIKSTMDIDVETNLLFIKYIELLEKGSND